MLLITKELAEAVIASAMHYDRDGFRDCYHCGAAPVWTTIAQSEPDIIHNDNCIVVRAKLLLEKEWGIKS